MSEIKVNLVTPRSGTTVTLGEAGDTIALGACASATGFGLSWCATVKTGAFCAAAGKGYFVNTCGGTITVTLPASPSAGDIVALKDYKDTWDSNKVTVGRNSSKIGGVCLDACLSTEGQTVTLVYVDGTQGWLNTQTDSTIVGNEFIAATGGNATVTCGDYKTHIFTGTGPLNVTSAGQPTGSTVFEYMVVAGGGSGGYGDGAGGGGGGFRYFSALSPAGSPLVAPAGQAATETDLTITVGGGAAGVGPGIGIQGDDSVFGTITSAGGGGGGAAPLCKTSAQDGGSGGGGVASKGAGCGNVPCVSPPQGQDGTSGPGQGGGGGGAGGVGGPSPGPTGGKGGLGSYIPDGFIGPTAPSYGTAGPVPAVRYFAGGAGGHGDGSPGPAPDGGGGGTGDVAPGPVRTPGTINTGGGGGGAQPNPTSGSGGSGIVMVRYKFQ